MSKQDKVERKRRRQAKALKRRHERKAAAPNPVVTTKSSMKKFKGALAGFNRFTDDDYMFWIAHGCNYLASDYEEGIWNPLFDEIYEGKLPTVEGLTQTILTRFGGDAADMPTEGKHVLSWTVQDKELVYLVSREAARAAKKADRSVNGRQAARLPKQSAVWEMFEGIRAESL